MNPAMIASWGSVYGCCILIRIIINAVDVGKLPAMTASHMVFARFRRQFEEDTAIRKDKRYRFWNERLHY